MRGEDGRERDDGGYVSKSLLITASQLCIGEHIGVQLQINLC